MELVDVYSEPDADAVLLYLLSEREPHQNISHRVMPTPAEHKAFIDDRPYLHWYLIGDGDDCEYVGAVYLSKQREIGVGVLKRYRGYGYARYAVRTLMGMHPGPFLANINPNNSDSIRLFTGLGFNLIQQTYAL